MSPSRRRLLVVSGVAFLVSVGALLVTLGVGPLEVLNTANQLAGVAGVLVGIASFFVSVIALVVALRSQDQPQVDLNAIVHELAGKIQRQWRAESGARQVNDPHPLPVAWEPAPAHLFSNVADTAAGWPPEHQAATTSELAEETLSTAILRVPGSRLVVLGEPGSGKTILLVRLTLGLLKNRQADSPVPVLLSVASWIPRAEALEKWLTRRIETEHPWLAEPAPGTSSGQSRLDLLLQKGAILPVLDGLDEIPDAVRRRAVTRINEWLQDDERIVVSCRRDEYAALVTQTDSVVGAKLKNAVGILLQPLTGPTVADYLVFDGGNNDESRRRWKPVTELLKVPPHVRVGDPPDGEPRTYDLQPARERAHGPSPRSRRPGWSWKATAAGAIDLATRRFIDLRRVFRRQPPLDVDFAFDVVFELTKPLNTNAVLSSPIPLHVSIGLVDERRTISPSEFHSDADLKSALRAGAWLPVATTGSATFRGQRAIDGGALTSHPSRTALADGCTHLLSLSTRPAQHSRTRSDLLQLYAALRLNAMAPGLGAAFLEADRIGQEDRRNLTLWRTDPLAESAVLDLCPPPGSSLSRHDIDIGRLQVAARSAYEVMAWALTGTFERAYPRLTTATTQQARGTAR